MQSVADDSPFAGICTTCEATCRAVVPAQATFVSSTLKESESNLSASGSFPRLHVTVE